MTYDAPAPFLSILLAFPPGPTGYKDPKTRLCTHNMVRQMPTGYKESVQVFPWLLEHAGEEVSESPLGLSLELASPLGKRRSVSFRQRTNSSNN